MVEPVDLQTIGSLLAESSGATIFPVEIAGVRHPGSSGKYGRVPGEGVYMDMRGHFGIREDFRFGAVSFDGHHIDEHPVVFFIAEQNLIVGCETKAIRFFHGFFPQRKRDSTK